MKIFITYFFSPTGGTKKVADIVAKGTKLYTKEIDLIKEPDKLMKVSFEKRTCVWLLFRPTVGVFLRS